ncbi:MAG: flagellar assembly protein FliH [Proteobacteria bacterium]|nr:flagellar assembly protein FliH [Pseudomonadota bacterium]
MTEPRKFDFDNDFGAGPAIFHAPPMGALKRKRVYLAEEVDEIRAAALREGEEAAGARAAEAQAHALAQIAEHARAGLTVLAQVACEHKASSAELALKAARVIAGGALEQFPHAPVAAALEALAREIESQPRLVVRMADPNEALQALVEGAARDAGFDGQIAFRIEPGPSVAAFAIEWADGKAGFDPEAAAQRISEAFASALAAEGLHGEPVTPASGA